MLGRFPPTLNARDDLLNLSLDAPNQPLQSRRGSESLMGWTPVKSQLIVYFAVTSAKAPDESDSICRTGGTLPIGAIAAPSAH